MQTNKTDNCSFISAVFISKLAVFLYNETFAGFFLSLVHFPGKLAPFFLQLVLLVSLEW